MDAAELRRIEPDLEALLAGPRLGGDLDGLRGFLSGSRWLCFGLGAGAETNQPLSIAVIGGMISSTLLTLVVVPAVYSLVESRRAQR